LDASVSLRSLNAPVSSVLAMPRLSGAPALPI
jgi:hypothetical protein